MLCTECNFRTRFWENMKDHYAIRHPDLNPDQWFTKEAKEK